jgi:hypothetical protein
MRSHTPLDFISDVRRENVLFTSAATIRKLLEVLLILLTKISKRVGVEYGKSGDRGTDRIKKEKG